MLVYERGRDKEIERQTQRERERERERRSEKTLLHVSAGINIDIS